MSLTRNPALNGRMPSWRLASVPWEPHQQVQRDALPSLLAMNVAYRADTRGLDLDLTDTYRALEGQWGQIATFLRNYKWQLVGGGYYGDVRWWRGVRYVRREGYPAAARPGTSNHGWGLAIDFGPACRRWVQTNGHRFGWYWPTWAQTRRSYEPWHIEAGNDVVLIDAPKPDPPSTPLPDPDVNTPDPIDTRDWFDMATEDQVREIIRGELERLFGKLGQADPVTGDATTPGTMLRHVRVNTFDIPRKVWDHELPDPSRAGVLTPVRNLALWARDGIVQVKTALGLKG